MKKSITIKIPEPCHENWAEMSSTEKGKFCNVCTKEVFDLTDKTDEELVKLLSSTKNACGRFKKSQLNREVKMERKSVFNFGPIAASIMLPLSILANSENSLKSSTIAKPYISLGIGIYKTSSYERMQIITTGVVRDEYGNTLRNVEIISNETEAREWTNYKGEYRIVTLNAEVLKFSLDNYSENTIQLANKSDNHDINLLKLVPEPFIVGEIAAPMIPITGKFVIQEDLIITKGIVTDETNLPLYGANIIVNGTNIGTQTDINGTYGIESKPNDKLVFSYVGFETKEVTLSNTNASIDLTLNYEHLMGEIIITGMISENPSQKFSPFFPFGKPDFKENSEQENARSKKRLAAKNTTEFKKIQKERRKEKL